METVFIAVLSLFAVYGIVSFIESLLDGFFEKNRMGDKIIIYVKASEERLEGVVRYLVNKNPFSEIFVLDENDSEEIKKIVDNLAKEYAYVYIGKAEY